MGYRNGVKKYFKISIWLVGGGKLIKEVDYADEIEELNWIKAQFIESMTINPELPYLKIENALIKFSDISAIDIEEKIE